MVFSAWQIIACIEKNAQLLDGCHIILLDHMQRSFFHIMLLLHIGRRNCQGCIHTVPELLREKGRKEKK